MKLRIQSANSELKVSFHIAVPVFCIVTSSHLKVIVRGCHCNKIFKMSYWKIHPTPTPVFVLSFYFALENVFPLILFL